MHEKAVKISYYEQQIKDECEEKARSYISLAIAKCAADQVSETAVSVVALPNDEMKGRIIGRGQKYPDTGNPHRRGHHH